MNAELENCLAVEKFFINRFAVEVERSR